jgi:uncharacterized membrane protein
MAAKNDNENLLAAASYLLFWITGLIILLVERDSKFVRFHAMQSTLLFGGASILLFIFGVIPILGWLIDSIIFIGGFILWIVLMWKAFQGEMYKVPYVGDLAIKQLAKMK